MLSQVCGYGVDMVSSKLLLKRVGFCNYVSTKFTWLNFYALLSLSFAVFLYWSTFWRLSQATFTLDCLHDGG